MSKMIAALPLAFSIGGGVYIPEKIVEIRLVDPDSTSIDSFYPRHVDVPTGAHYNPHPVHSLVINAADMVEEVVRALPVIDSEVEFLVDRLVEQSYTQLESKPLSRKV